MHLSILNLALIFMYLRAKNQSLHLYSLFKVDPRICLSVEGKYYAISSIELKKRGKEPYIVKADGCKVLTEAKTILN